MFKPKPDTTIDVEDLGIDFVLEPPPPAPISVVTLAAELGEPVDQLVSRLGDDLFIEPATGLRCVAVEVCRWVIDQQARSLAERERRAREHFDALAAKDAAARRVVVAADEHLQSLAFRGLDSRR